MIRLLLHFCGTPALLRRTCCAVAFLLALWPALAAAQTYETLDPNTLFAGPLLSGGNLIITGNTNNQIQGATVATGQLPGASGGKFIFGGTLNTNVDNSEFIGLLATNDYEDIGLSSCWYYIAFCVRANGDVQISVTTVATLGTGATSCNGHNPSGTVTICSGYSEYIAVDLVNQKAWFTITTDAGIVWGPTGGDPTNPSTGIGLSSIPAQLYLHPFVTVGEVSDQWAMDFGPVNVVNLPSGVPTGYTAGWPVQPAPIPTAAAYNPVLNGPYVTTYDGNRSIFTSTYTSGSYYTGATSSTALTAGKYDIQALVVNTLAGGGGAFGLLVGTLPPNYENVLGGTGSARIDTNGVVTINGSQVATLNGGSGVGNAATEEMAIDVTNKLAWFRCTGCSTTAWNGSGSANPTTGAGGFDISGLTGPYYLFSAYKGVQQATKINFADQTCSPSPPTGFACGVPISVIAPMVLWIP